MSATHCSSLFVTLACSAWVVSVPMHLMRSNLNVAALKQADGLAVAPPHRRRGISCRRVSSQVRAGYVTGGSIAVLTRQRTSEKDFECLASTGVTRKEKYFEGWAAAFG